MLRARHWDRTSRCEPQWKQLVRFLGQSLPSWILLSKSSWEKPFHPPLLALSHRIALHSLWALRGNRILTLITHSACAISLVNFRTPLFSWHISMYSYRKSISPLMFGLLRSRGEWLSCRECPILKKQRRHPICGALSITHRVEGSGQNSFSNTWPFYYRKGMDHYASIQIDTCHRHIIQSWMCQWEHFEIYMWIRRRPFITFMISQHFP